MRPLTEQIRPYLCCCVQWGCFQHRLSKVRTLVTKFGDVEADRIVIGYCELGLILLTSFIHRLFSAD